MTDFANFQGNFCACLPTLASKTTMILDAFLLMEIKHLFTLEHLSSCIQVSGRFVYLLVSRTAAPDEFLYWPLISILLM